MAANDIFTIILTSVSVELMDFAYKTEKLSDEDVNKLTDDIVKRLNRKLLDVELDDFVDWKLRAIMDDTKNSKK